MFSRKKNRITFRDSVENRYYERKSCIWNNQRHFKVKKKKKRNFIIFSRVKIFSLNLTYWPYSGAFLVFPATLWGVAATVAQHKACKMWSMHFQHFSTRSSDCKKGAFIKRSSFADFSRKTYNYGIGFKIEFSLSFNVKYPSFSGFRRYITTNVVPVRIRNDLETVYTVNNSLLIYNAMWYNLCFFFVAERRSESGTQQCGKLRVERQIGGRFLSHGSVCALFRITSSLRRILIPVLANWPQCALKQECQGIVIVEKDVEHNVQEKKRSQTVDVL